MWLLLGSVVIVGYAMIGFSLLLVYRICLRATATTESLTGSMTGVVTELISAKTFTETGNERLANNMLVHGTNQTHALRTPAPPIVPPVPEDYPRPDEQTIGPALSDAEILGFETMAVGGSVPPEDEA